MGIVRFQRRSIRSGSEGHLVQVINQNAANLQHRGNEQQMPFERQRIILAPPQLQRRIRVIIAQ